MKTFSCILARDSKNGGIGYKNSLPWKLKSDMENFKKITTTNSSSSKNYVVMGRNTFTSLKKPLLHRKNIVISSTMKPDEDVEVFPNLNNCLENTNLNNSYLFVIGGRNLYKETFLNPYLECIYLTEVEPLNKVEYDVYFTEEIPLRFRLESEFKIEENNCIIKFKKYVNLISTQENNYLNLLNKVISDGEEKIDRTGVGTISLFGEQLTFDISEYFPLLTTKKLDLRVIFEELMWFLRGQTNKKILNEKNVKIWDGNGTKEYMKKIGLDYYPEGELGPIYGAQWRNFGGKHDLTVTNHISKDNNDGVDQIKNLIETLKTDPHSRRMIVSAWNPKELNNIALPSCHYSFQIYLRKDKYLDCKVNIRSNDLFLGAPFNIASYSLLVYMLAYLTGYSAGKLYYSIGDSHIYKNHIDQVKLQLTRNLRVFPKLKIIGDVKNIEDFEFENIELKGYNPHPHIKASMAV